MYLLTHFINTRAIQLQTSKLVLPSRLIMSSNEAPNNGHARHIRILMLHGFTQSGPGFRAKVRALEKQLAKALAPRGLHPTFRYPTGPLKLAVDDIPGYADSASAAARIGDRRPEPEAYAWYRRDDATGTFRMLDKGMERVSQAIVEMMSGASIGDGETDEAGGASGATAGPIDGVMGFSQGASLATLVAAALELPHRTAPPEHAGWAQRLREANGGVPLRFFVAYSGPCPADPQLRWLLQPPLHTPSLHILGSLDGLVTEEMSRQLVDRCQDATVVTHPGGHHVPVAKEWATAVAGFLINVMAV